MIMGEYIASIISVEVSIGDISRVLPAACGRVVSLPDSLPSAKADAINQCGIVCSSPVNRDVEDIQVIPGFSVGHVNSIPVDPVNISLAIKGYIDRINWDAINVAYAVAWDDLYILHVPIDGATANNATLVYCVSLGTWQGIWQGYNSTAGCRQDSGNVTNRYLYGDNAGNIFSHYHQQDNIYVDTVNGNIGAGVTYASQITTRGYRFDQETNLIQPYNVVLELVNTLVPVTVQILADNNLVGSTHTIAAQSVAGSVLPV